MKFIKWYAPYPKKPWTAWSEDGRIWYEATKAEGGGWNLSYGYRSGIDGVQELDSYKYLADAKAAAAHHYRSLVTSP
jgi:hypothetical protein